VTAPLVGVRRPSLVAAVVFGLSLGLFAGQPSCGRSTPPAQIALFFRVEQELFRPEYLLVAWYGPNGREKVGVRVPSSGPLAASGMTLGSLMVDLGGAPAGERRISVWGMRGRTMVSGAVMRVMWNPGERREVALVLGCMRRWDITQPPLDGGMLDAASWVECNAGTINPPPSVASDAAAPAGDGGGGFGPTGGPGGSGGGADAAASPPPRAPDAGAGGGGDRSPAGLAPPRPPLPPWADLARGLVMHLRLDDPAASATARDSSGNGNTATLQGLDPRAAWVEGQFGGALALGGRGWLTVEPSASLNAIAEGFTIAAWIDRAAGDGTIVARRASSALGSGYLYKLAVSGGRLSVLVNSGASPPSGRAELTASGSLPSRRFTHVAASYDRLNVRLYADGQVVAMQRYELPVGPPAPVAVTVGGGQDMAGTGAMDRFAGTVDEVTLYDRPLSDAEIAGLANGHLPPAR
jgi:hypothetical protein